MTVAKTKNCGGESILQLSVTTNNIPRALLIDGGQFWSKSSLYSQTEQDCSNDDMIKHAIVMFKDGGLAPFKEEYCSL